MCAEVREGTSREGKRLSFALTRWVGGLASPSAGQPIHLFISPLLQLLTIHLLLTPLLRHGGGPFFCPGIILAWLAMAGKPQDRRQK